MNKIDVVYTIGTESRFNDEELRYSLRSLINLKELGNVYIIGTRPHWVNPYEVIHLYLGDPAKNNKDCNLISKLLLACYQQELSDQFIWFSDDQLLLNEVPIEVFKNPTIDNSHLDFMKQERLNRWQTRLNRTVAILKERGWRHDCYEAHIPYMLNKQEFPKTILQYDYGYEAGYCGNTLYFNSTQAEGRENADRVLLRLVNKPESEDLLVQSSSQKYFLNYSDSAINNILFSFLQKKFPTKSRFEM